MLGDEHLWPPSGVKSPHRSSEAPSAPPPGVVGTPSLASLAMRAGRARSRAEALVRRSAELHASNQAVCSACLMTETWIVDHVGATQHRDAYVARLSGIVGRDPAIERAKAAVADRYGISRGQAFELLRHMSQHANRKLRDLAHDVLAEQAS
jgi:hypothetical protein